MRRLGGLWSDTEADAECSPFSGSLDFETKIYWKYLGNIKEMEITFKYYAIKESVLLRKGGPKFGPCCNEETTRQKDNEHSS